MNEDYLHYIWKYQLYFPDALQTTGREKLEIIRPGFHNTDSGPDFFDGRIRINSTQWAGNVEIHVNSSDWNKHRHSSDPAYGNVILHVVYNHDEEIADVNNRILPTLELKNRIDPVQFDHYLRFISREKMIPCSNLIRDTGELVIRQQIDRAIVNRLERKFHDVLKIYEQSDHDWEQTFYVMLAKNFGFRVNAIPFETLAWVTPLSLLRRAAGSSLRMEAMLFGQAGLLPDSADHHYVSALIREYNLLKTMHGFRPMDRGQWKFSRMRPVNFPSIRIAQFAALIKAVPSLFRFFLEAADPDELISRFSVCASSYWDDHYTFSRSSPQQKKYFGSASVYNVMINTVAPVLFAYGRERKEQEWCDRSLGILENIPAEENGIIRKWTSVGVKALNAADTQGLIELKNEWCFRKKCLNCIIGNQLLRNHYDKEYT